MKQNRLDIHLSIMQDLSQVPKICRIRRIPGQKTVGLRSIGYRKNSIKAVTLVASSVEVKSIVQDVLNSPSHLSYHRR